MKNKRKLKAIFAMPSWKRPFYTTGRKHSRELSNEEKARKGQPINMSTPTETPEQMAERLCRTLPKPRGYAGDADRNYVKEAIAAAIQAERDRAEKLSIALAKINAIRNSIIGCQSINWSEHIYPLVAALNEAGIQAWIIRMPK
jgi:hypothetical protein